MPGLSSQAEARLLKAFDRTFTIATSADFVAPDYTLLGGSDDNARRLGIVATGPGEPTVAVTDPDRLVGHVAIEATGRDALLGQGRLMHPARINPARINPG